MTFKMPERRLIQIVESLKKHNVPLAAGLAGMAILTAILASHGDSETHVIFKSTGPVDFKNASILGNPNQGVLKGEERLFTRQTRNLMESQGELKGEIEKLRDEVKQLTIARNGMQDNLVGASPSASPSPGSSPIYGPFPGTIPYVGSAQSPGPTLGPPVDGFQGKQISQTSVPPKTDQINTTASSATRPSLGISQDYSNYGRSRVSGKPGASMISFPVKTTGSVAFKGPEITLPSGSYVKAKLLKGVEAPEGKTYPALMQLDYAYIIPNHKRLDLNGCFIIAKATGDLSTERVQMQATKLSCVSKRGGMFEREINGFIADDVDNSFAVLGSVNTKQDRVAAMAFLASIVSGVGKAVQMAQTTQQTTPLGGSQSVITGDQAKYIGAGGAADAATMVSQWYLKQAQNLLPTINIGSGQDVWIIMQDKVELPKAYFNQNSEGGNANASIYSYFTRVID